MDIETCEDIERFCGGTS